MDNPGVTTRCAALRPWSSLDIHRVITGDDGVIAGDGHAIPGDSGAITPDRSVISSDTAVITGDDPVISDAAAGHRRSLLRHPG